ncbi:MAG: peptidyl-tRNA hydrolase Pth2 [Candidatus Diapherotrites archaeon]|nr:peptidyl-tRNA hydrolase Pth2 [Candidatus Diapherotrites archaeon]
MELKQILIVRTDLKMGKGKVAAQCCHASIEAYETTKKKNPEYTELWKEQGMPKVVLKVKDEIELMQIYEKLKKYNPVLIKDAGKTQVEPNTITCLGVGPAPSKYLDKITKNLKLL